MKASTIIRNLATAIEYRFPDRTPITGDDLVSVLINFAGELATHENNAEQEKPKTCPRCQRECAQDYDRLNPHFVCNACGTTFELIEEPEA